MNHDIFISYSHENITAAQAICHELEDKGIKCWMAPRDIPVGAKYASVISKAIVHSKIVVLVFSDYSARSPWVESEINIAFSNRKTIIPYKIDKTNYEEFDEFYLMLNNRHWIEAYPDYKTRFKELVSIVAQTLSKPAPTPIPTPIPSDPKNLKRYWWVTICTLILGVAIWGVLPENSVESIETHMAENSEKVELQHSNSDLQKNINDFKAKEAQQTKNKAKENLAINISTQKQTETNTSTSTLNNEPKSVQTKTEQKPETPKEVVAGKNNEYAGRSEREMYLLNLPDDEFVQYEENNGQRGYKLKSTGEIVIYAKYDYAGDFREGLLAVKLKDKWGYIDKTGKVVIDLKYDSAYSFNGGLAWVQLNGEEFYIDKNGNRVEE